MHLVGFIVSNSGVFVTWKCALMNFDPLNCTGVMTLKAKCLEGHLKQRSSSYICCELRATIWTERRVRLAGTFTAATDYVRWPVPGHNYTTVNESSSDGYKTSARDNTNQKNAWIIYLTWTFIVVVIVPDVMPNRYSTLLRILVGGGLNGAGGRAYWEWSSGEKWVFICLEHQCDEVNSTYGGEKTVDQTWRCISDSLLGYRSRIPPAKNRALPYTPVCGRWHGGTVVLHCYCTREFQSVAYPGILLGGGGSTNSVEDRENGDLGALAP